MSLNRSAVLENGRKVLTMPKEYIKRGHAVDAVLDVYCDTPDIDLSCEKFEAAILKIPAADVAVVQHGRWTFGKDLPDSFGSSSAIVSIISVYGVIG